MLLVLSEQQWEEEEIVPKVTDLHLNNLQDKVFPFLSSWFCMWLLTDGTAAFSNMLKFYDVWCLLLDHVSSLHKTNTIEVNVVF